MNQAQIANNPTWDQRTRVITIAAGGPASLEQAVAAQWVAQGGNANDIVSGRIAGLLVSANTAAVQITTAATSGVGLEIATNTSLYIPLANSSGASAPLYTATAAFGVTVFFTE